MKKNIIIAFIIKALTFFLFILFNVILARTIGVDKFGIWSLFISVLTVLSTLSYFGINESTRRYVAKYSGTKYLKNIFIDSLKLRLQVSLIFSLIILIFSLILWGKINHLTVGMFLFFIPLLTFLYSISEYGKAFYQGLHDLYTILVINLIEHVGKLLFLIVFLYSSLINKVFALIIPLLLVILFLLTKWSFLFKKIKILTKKTFKKNILQYSYPFVLIGFGFMILTEVDTVMLSWLSNTKDVGIYSAAKQLVLKVPHIAIAITMAIMPVFAKLCKNNKESLQLLFKRIVKWSFLLFITISILLICFAEKIIIFFYGIDFFNSILLLQILAVYIFFVSLSTIFSALLDYTGYAKRRAKNIVITIIINIILNYILIPKYGAVGAAITTVISYIPYLLLNIIESKIVFSNKKLKTAD